VRQAMQARRAPLRTTQRAVRPHTHTANVCPHLEHVRGVLGTDEWVWVGGEQEMKGGEEQAVKTTSSVTRSTGTSKPPLAICDTQSSGGALVLLTAHTHR
jgi:hypothetical protein